MYKRRQARDLFVLVVCTVTLAACGKGVPDIVGAVTGAGKVKPADIVIPSQVLGLEVKPEDVSKQIKQARRPYIDSIGFFSLREADLVRATFQVSRFNDIAQPENSSFRQSIIGLLGSSKPVSLKVSGETVFATTGTEQSIFVWFKGRAFFVLTTHRQYEFPRTLLRRMVEVEKAL
ncbi:MAG: hypothetical protein ABR507_04210 [Actinomycetota bacterium]|nr:hypothetical protein [Actinomycetota bacterium]